MTALLMVLALTSAARAEHELRTPEKCGRVLLHAMHARPGIVLEPPVQCASVTVPKRYTVVRNPNPIAVDLYLGTKRMGTLYMRELDSPAPVEVKQQPKPKPTRWRDGGMEFVEVSQGGTRP